MLSLSPSGRETGRSAVSPYETNTVDGFRDNYLTQMKDLQSRTTQREEEDMVHVDSFANSSNKNAFHALTNSISR